MTLSLHILPEGFPKVFSLFFYLGLAVADKLVVNVVDGVRQSLSFDELFRRFFVCYCEPSILFSELLSCFYYHFAR